MTPVWRPLRREAVQEVEVEILGLEVKLVGALARRDVLNSLELALDAGRL